MHNEVWTCTEIFPIELRKNLEQKVTFNWVHSHGINERLLLH